MPVSLVVGGQFGSEGKGKVALEIARRATERSVTLVRVGGPNSGHTGYDKSGNKFALRQLPAGCIDRNVDVVFPAGSYIDDEVLFREIEELNYPTNRIFISPFARVITAEHKTWEKASGLIDDIGSTGSGVGAAVMASAARGARNFELQSVLARDWAPLAPFMHDQESNDLIDTTKMMRNTLQKRGRIIVEGTQGFGLSLLEGGYENKATSRSTTAAAALSEAGLSPMDVDDVTLVIRSFPIRVAGDSGPLAGELDWKDVAKHSGSRKDLREYTTVTKKLRRVGEFDAELVKRAIEANHPTRLVLNHVDYLGPLEELASRESSVSKFIDQVESNTGRRIDWLGFSGLDVVNEIEARSFATR
ncbi:MAG: adenylosuccinate synthetase [Shimia thalassica]|uniref:adenylosuccinate synthetase n=1 Tax=Shimia thalassica TaxID=1715693 RepID=UPI00329A5099